MLKKQYFFFLCAAIVLVYLIIKPGRVSALPQPQQAITSPAQLIETVNNLRVSSGLPTLAVHPILMQTAQTQADYMAATGQITHVRPGGITYTQQLLMLGFPLAGDLSLGGFRAENILMQTDPLVWTGVPPAWQDPAHMNTMLSGNFTHIGAGITHVSGGYYYAVDCAAVTGSGQMQGSASAILTTAPGTPGSDSSAVSQFMIPIVKSTARSDGDVYHTVQNGQTLWSIAIEYGTTIKSIQALNNLGESLVIYQGQELLVKKGATQQAPPASPTIAQSTRPLPTESLTSTVTPSYTMPTTFLSPTALPPNKAGSSSSSVLVVVLIVAAFVGAAMAVWLIRDPRG